MKISIKALILLLSTLVIIAGCSTNDDSTRLCADDDGNFYQCSDIEISSTPEEKKSNDFHSKRSFQTINEYTEQMVYQLNNKLSNINITGSIVVPPFVSLSPIESSNPYLTIDLAEAFIIDMQNIGLPTAELLVANTSAEYQADYLTYLDESINHEDIDYILKGTIRKTDNGMMIYARVIEIKSKKVIASTSKLLPFYLIK